MRNMRRILTPTTARFKTSMARQIAVEHLQAALDYKADAEKKQRLKNGYCRTCFYLRRGLMAGQAFTAWECGICGAEKVHHHTGTPVVCAPCSKEHRICVECGGDIGTNTKRGTWPTPASSVERVVQDAGSGSEQENPQT